MARVIHVEKPWGFFDQYTLNEKSTVKIISVNPHHKLSLQSHEMRDELWVFIDEGLVAEVEGKKIASASNSYLFIPRKSKHRLINNTDYLSRVLEISFGDFDENDITRYEDEYGRV